MVSNLKMVRCYLLFKELQVFKAIDDVLYRNLSERAHETKFRFVNDRIEYIINYIGDALVGADYDFLGNTTFINSYGSNTTHFIIDEMFNAVYNAESFNEMLDRLAVCKFEVDMIKFYNGVKVDKYEGEFEYDGKLYKYYIGG